MKTIKTVEEILIEWNIEAEKLETAIQNRNFREFRKSFAFGCKCFKRIREMIETGHAEELKEHGQQLKKTMDRWQKSADNLPCWMEEISEKAKKVHTKRTNQKKIGNAYNFIKKAGHRLKVKAK